MKKSKVIILFLIISTLLSAAAIFFVCFNTIGLVTLPKQERIESFDTQGTSIIAAVTEQGNVYIEGDLTDESNYGLDKVRQYDHLFNKRLVRIYEKGDARTVSLSPFGGCIVTEHSDVFVFVNGSRDYQTPTYLCSGYQKAYVVNNDVYLLSDDGEFGCVSIDNPDDFVVLAYNVVDYCIEYSKNKEYDVCFVLTSDNRLYITELGKYINDSVQHINDIIGFDISTSYARIPEIDNGLTKHIEISLLNKNHDAFWLNGNIDKGFSYLADISNYTLTGKNISSVVSFPYGIAMHNQSGNVSLYGSDFGRPNSNFMGEIVFHDVKAIFGGQQLIIMHNNGLTMYFGNIYNSNAEKYIRPLWMYSE